MGVLRGFCGACLASESVKTQFAACALTGQEADLDGVCVEHGETACVMTVHAAPTVPECTIPGCPCTHQHDGHPVQ
jgi:recombinational DNA repair protein (RecF pathway)